MVFELYLDKNDINTILEKCGYVKEEVILWYYNRSCDLKPISTKIAYKIGERPETLEQQYPDLEEHDKFKLENVIKSLLKKRLLEHLF